MIMLDARRRLRLAILPLLLVPLLSACGGDEPATAPTAGGAPTGAPSGAAATPLDLALVQSLTAPRFQTDPNCGYGQWSENPTGIDEEYRGSATTIQQFDCYGSESEVGGLPKRGQQSIYVEFGDPTVASAFAKDESTLYATLVDGPRVVVAGLGLESVDMKAYLEEIKSACGCGEVLTAG